MSTQHFLPSWKATCYVTYHIIPHVEVLRQLKILPLPLSPPTLLCSVSTCSHYHYHYQPESGVWYRAPIPSESCLGICKFKKY